MAKTLAGLVVLTGLLVAATGRGGAEPPGLKVAETISISRTVGGEPPVQFNFACSYVISLNMKLPRADQVRKTLVETLARTGLRDHLLFNPFTPDRAPELVEVMIGSKVPVEAVRVVLREVSRVPDLKLALSVLKEDDVFGNTQRVYIGGLVPSGRRPATPEQLKALLAPDLTHQELLGLLEKAEGPAPAQAADVKPVPLKISLRSGGADEDLKAFREALARVPGITFKADEIRFSDIKREETVFTSPFTIEITDLAKTDIGAVAKAVAAANTAKKERSPPVLYLVIRYKPDSASNEQLRAALARVKGVRADQSWAGDANLWVQVDGSGQGKLIEITRALHAAKIPIRDPITDRP
jgi:hypothetical protein